MKARSLVAWLLALTALSAACGGAPSTSEPASPSARPTPPLGAIEGKLGYPGPFIPPLRIYAVRIDQPMQPYVVSTIKNQPNYHVAVVAGVYNILSYPQSGGGSLRAGYTRAVLCGLMATCTDHGLISVTVQPGQTFIGADPTDWYAPGSLPPEPSG